jgi:hypothetical protein
MIKTSDLSSRATNGSPGGSDSALSVPAVGAAFAGADEKELSKVAKRFLIAEINRLAEENQQLKALQEKYHNLDKKMVAGPHPTGTFHPIRGFARPSSGTVRIALLAVAVGACAGAISNFDAAIFNKGTAIIPTEPLSVPSAHPDAAPSFSVESKRAAVNETDPTMGMQTEVVKTESFSRGSKTQNAVTSFDDNNLAKQPEAQTSIDRQLSSNLAPAAAQQGQRDLWSTLVRYVIFGQQSERPIPRQTKVAESRVQSQQRLRITTVHMRERGTLNGNRRPVRLAANTATPRSADPAPPRATGSTRQEAAFGHSPIHANR